MKYRALCILTACPPWEVPGSLYVEPTPADSPACPTCGRLAVAFDLPWLFTRRTAWEMLLDGLNDPTFGV